MIKSFTIAALAASFSQAAEVKELLEVISNLQVNQRTLLNAWSLDMEYEVDATSENDPSKNVIYLTTILKNDKVLENFNRKIQDGEIF